MSLSIWTLADKGGHDRHLAEEFVKNIVPNRIYRDFRITICYGRNKFFAKFEMCYYGYHSNALEGPKKFPPFNLF